MVLKSFRYLKSTSNYGSLRSITDSAVSSAYMFKLHFEKIKYTYIYIPHIFTYRLCKTFHEMPQNNIYQYISSVYTCHYITDLTCQCICLSFTYPIINSVGLALVLSFFTFSFPEKKIFIKITKERH